MSTSALSATRSTLRAVFSAVLDANGEVVRSTPTGGCARSLPATSD